MNLVEVGQRIKDLHLKKGGGFGIRTHILLPRGSFLYLVYINVAFCVCIQYCFVTNKH